MIERALCEDTKSSMINSRTGTTPFLNQEQDQPGKIRHFFVIPAAKNHTFILQALSALPNSSTLIRIDG